MSMSVKTFVCILGPMIMPLHVGICRKILTSITRLLFLCTVKTA